MLNPSRGRLLIPVLLALLPSASRGQSLPFATYSSDDGLAESVVLAVEQDRDGYLWFGTPDGVSRFDGVEFTNFDESHGLPSPVVRTLFEDSAGTLWAGTDAGLASWRGDGWESAHAGVLEHSVRGLTEDGDGVLWAATYGGAARLDGDDVTVFTSADGLAHDRVRAVLHDRQGRLWLGTYGGGVSRYEDGRFTSYGEGEGLADAGVRALAEYGDGLILAGTNTGVFQWTGDGFAPFADASALAGSTIMTFLEDRRGRLWLGTRDRGACLADSGDCYSLDQGLGDTSVNDLFEDREGNLWFATFGGGASRLTNESFLNFTTRTGLPYGSVQAFAEVAGEIWIATHGGGVSRWVDGRLVALDVRLRGGAPPVRAASISRPCRPAVTASWCVPATATACGARKRRGSRSRSRRRCGRPGGCARCWPPLPASWSSPVTACGCAACAGRRRSSKPWCGSAPPSCASSTPRKTSSWVSPPTTCAARWAA